MAEITMRNEFKNNFKKKNVKSIRHKKRRKYYWIYKSHWNEQFEKHKVSFMQTFLILIIVLFYILTKKYILVFFKIIELESLFQHFLLTLDMCCSIIEGAISFIGN